MKKKGMKKKGMKKKGMKNSVKKNGTCMKRRFKKGRKGKEKAEGGGNEKEKIKIVRKGRRAG